MIKLVTDSGTLSELEAFGDELVKRIQAEMQNKGLNASGNLSNSLEYRIENLWGETHLTVYGDEYFLYAEKGRGPGRVPRNFGEILAEWAEDKRVSLPPAFKDYRQFGWATASKIRKYGSERHRENKPLDILGPVVDEMIPKLNGILTNSLTFYINNVLF